MTVSSPRLLALKNIAAQHYASTPLYPRRVTLKMERRTPRSGDRPLRWCPCEHGQIRWQDSAQVGAVAANSRSSTCRVLDIEAALLLLLRRALGIVKISWENLVRIAASMQFAHEHESCRLAPRCQRNRKSPKSMKRNDGSTQGDRDIGRPKSEQPARNEHPCLSRSGNLLVFLPSRWH